VRRRTPARRAIRLVDDDSVGGGVADVDVTLIAHVDARRCRDVPLKIKHAVRLIFLDGKVAQISDIHVLRPVDGDVAGPGQLAVAGHVPPLGLVLALRRELLHAPVVIVHDVDVASIIHGHVGGVVKLPGTRPELPPLPNEYAVPGQLHPTFRTFRRWFLGISDLHKSRDITVLCYS